MKPESASSGACHPMLSWKKRVALVNARVAARDGVATSIRFDSRVLGVDTPPRNGDVVVDLEGAFVLNSMSGLCGRAG